MSTNDIQNSPTWKKPDEVMQLLRLKQKKRSLQKLKERMRQPSQSCPDLSNVFGKPDSPNFSRILGGAEKRKNPFSKNKLEKEDKVFCKNTDSIQDESTDSTLFQLLGFSEKEKKDNENNKPQESTLTSFTNILSNLENKNSLKENEQEIEVGNKYIPIDWTLKTRMRLMSPKEFSWNNKLKASEEASGITGFVRCLDTSNSSTLDTSHHARFHQNCLYWQHPNLPSINLFPRTNGRISNRNFISTHDEVKNALHKEWTESFRSLFQLIRARQCPYFYVCANTFTCLFRAAGIGGIAETCAFISPTTRGFRQLLQQEEIEFTMPLKRQEKKKSDRNKSDNKDGDGTKNSSTDSCYDTMDNTNSIDDNSKSNTINANNIKNEEDEEDDDDDMESGEWLQSLGVTDDIIKNINHAQMRIDRAAESQIDSSAESLVCVRGVDAQALFNFLLNCKSSIALTGTYGGIPPTLLSPTSFQGSTLKCLKVRHSTVHSENGKYYSIELRGPILPTTLHTLCSLIESNSNPFSGTFANYPHTTTFSKVAKILTEDEKNKEQFAGKTPSVFGQENLSDCGLKTELLQHFCSSEPSVVETITALKYCSDKKVYMWT